MSDCLWNDIDAYLLTELVTELGADSATYADILLAQVVAGDTFDPDQVSYPFCLVRGFEVEDADAGPHGDGDVHYDLAYPYELVLGVVEPTLDAARTDIKELLRRAREFIRARPAFGQLSAADGETIVEVMPGRVRVELYGKNGINQGAYMGLASVSFTVKTEI